MSCQGDIIDCLCSFPQVKVAVLFGSGATGRSRPDSDVDIGVLLDPPDQNLGSARQETAPLSNHELLQQMDLAISRAVGRPVDLVDLSTAPPLLQFEVARTGVLLIERTPHAWVDLKAHAMISWWDWAPTARTIHAAAASRLRRQVAHGST